MHTETKQKQNLEGRAEQRQNIGTGTGADRSIDTYYELLRSGRPLSELLSEVARNADRTPPTKSDFAVQPDAQKLEIDTDNEAREDTGALLENVAEHIEPVQCHEPHPSGPSEILAHVELIEPWRPSPYRARLGGATVAAVGAIGIFLYPVLTHIPSLDVGPPLQKNAEQRPILSHVETPRNTSGELTGSAIEAVSKTQLGLSTSVTTLSSGSDIVNSKVPTEGTSPAPPSVMSASTVAPVSASTTAVPVATVEVKSVPSISSTPGDDPALAATATSVISSIAGHQMTKEEIAALVSRGDDLLVLADVVSARLFYERAANAGDAQAALRLGESYDPSFLGRARLAGTRGELAKAAYWYRYARDLGLSEADLLLGQLEKK